MAGTSLLTLIDDVATLLDDISVMTKVAAKKTAGVLGDDLALNAEQVTGISAKRELPVIWKVAKGALLNKVIIVPAALLISAFVNWLIIPLLMCGGAFLCYEGFHKVFHKLFHHDDEKKQKDALRKAAAKSQEEVLKFEKKKIKGAIRTDFILSAEIIVITLGVVGQEPLGVQVGVLSVVALGMVVVVYGLVGGIVKIDDVGLALTQKEGEGAMTQATHAVGEWILEAAPIFMKGLGIVGTAAMFLVGGGIFAHNIPPIEDLIHKVALAAGPLEIVVPTVMNGILGIIIGGVLMPIVGAASKLKNSVTDPDEAEEQPASE
ncbi:MAG: DUF808 domain-containing protein [Myxococcota bacterium]